MDLVKYAVLSIDNHKRYEFFSSGPKGIIKKVVDYIEVAPHVYNLAFGDWDEETQEIKDNIKTNNGDRDKVLATVASTVIDFMGHYPYATVFAEGETPIKTRLYQMGINANWSEISQLFRVEGFVNGRWELFDRNKNYEAFLVLANRNL